MYQPPSYHHRPRAQTSYFLPFLSLIILGLIVVLVFQIVDYFQEKRVKALENKAALHVAAGRAEMKIWGVDQWAPALDGSILHEGDALRTAPGSRLVLSLLNGSAVRLGSESEVELAQLKSRDGEDQLSLKLSKGDVWLKRTEKDVVRTAFSVTTPNLTVSSSGTVFSVTNGPRQAVRVLNGKVRVSVKVLEGDSKQAREVQSLEVALGQEVNLGTEELLDLQNNQPVELLTLLSDDFRNSDWYAWNNAQDSVATASVSVAQAVAKEKTPPVPGAAAVQEEEAAPVSVSTPSDVATPVILSPKESERTVKTGQVVISGTVGGAHPEKIEVTTSIGGKDETYALKKYRPGDTNWSYVASAQYGNLVAGENRFTVRAVGKDGTKSEPAEITIFYDRPKEPADLSAPTVMEFNDETGAGSAYITAEEVVKVEGKIGKGIVKVMVDDFVLTRYVPDSGVWMYYAKTAYGNLKEGANTYEVYGVDFDGNKTPAVKFTITRKTKPDSASESAPSAPASEPVL